MVKHDLAAQTIYCITDKKAIPEERAVRKSNMEFPPKCEHKDCNCRAALLPYYRQFTIDVRGLCAKHQRQMKWLIIWGWVKEWLRRPTL